MDYEPDNRKHPRRHDDGRQGGDRRGGGHPRSEYRQPYDRNAELKRRLTALIVKVGDDTGPALHNNLENLSMAIKDDFEEHSALVLDAVNQCVSDLPMNTSIYGSLIGLLNFKNELIGGRVVEMLSKSLATAVEGGRWRELKLKLRFMVELGNSQVIVPESLMLVLDNLTAVICKGNVKKDCAECYARILLLTLPVLSQKLVSKCKADIDRIMSEMDTYFVKRRVSFEGEKNILCTYSQDKCGYSQEDTLDLLWKQIQDLMKNDWQFPALLRPYESYEETLAQGTQHSVPSIDFLPPPHALFPLPRFLFRLFPGSTTSIPQTNIAFSFIHDVVADVIDIYEVNRKECVRVLLSVKDSYTEGTFVLAPPPQVQTDPNQECVESAAHGGWCFDEIIAENLFASLFHLPVAPRKLVYYSVLLMEIIRGAPETFPKIIGRSIFSLFNRLDGMDVECAHRLHTYFAHHLSNYNYSWAWIDWIPVVKMDPQAPKRVFIQSTLIKCIRLSFLQRVKSVLPPEFLTEIPEVEPGPSFKYDSTEEDAALREKVTVLLSLLKSKRSPDEIHAALHEIREHADGPMSDYDSKETPGSRLARDALIQCLLQLGSKSFSHVLNVVERYLSVLQTICGTHATNGSDAKLHTVQVVASFWKNNPQFLGIILDKFLNYRVIDPAAIVDWVFADLSKTGDFSRFYIWEILTNMLTKVGTRVVQLRERLANLKTETENGKQESKPETAKMRASTEATLSHATKEQKDVFFSVLKGFVSVIDQRLSKSTPEENELWLLWAEGWFREIGRLYHPVIAEYIWSIENVILTPSVHPRVKEVFGDIRSLVDARKAELPSV